MLALLAWAVPLVGLAQWALLEANLRRFSARPAAGAPATERVSVLVPARNEAARIAGCIAAIRDRPGCPIELLVLDDQSEDDTAAIARQAAGPDPRVRLLTGQPLPAGWSGKPHACHQLAQAAEGTWLFFVDADTRLAPGAIAEAVALAEAEQADLLSFWPRQTMRTPGEQLMLPLLAFILLAYLPLGLAERRSAPSLVAANGQALLVRRSRYLAIGGHAARPRELVEDLALARGIKAAGGRVVVRDAGAGASCRMYEGWDAIWRGFRKNLFPAFGGRPGPFLAGLSALLGLHGLPPLLALGGLLAHQPIVWMPMGLQGLIGWLCRARIARRLGHPGWSVWAHPLAVWLVSLLALDSWRGYHGRGVEWKGRTYRQEA